MASLPKIVIALAVVIFIFPARIQSAPATFSVDDPQISAVNGISSGGSFSVAGALHSNPSETLSKGDFELTGNFSNLIFNHAPFAAPSAFTRLANDDIKIQISQLLANDFDADGDKLSIELAPKSESGAEIEVIGSWIYYFHVSNVPDSFTYTVSDAFGASSQGRVNILIADPDSQFSTGLRIASDGAGVHINFNAIEGRAYIVQSRDTLETPWIDRATATDLGSGLFQFDDAPGTETRFYRIVYRP